MIDEAAIRLRWDTVGSRLDERGRRLFAAAEMPRQNSTGGKVRLGRDIQARQPLFAAAADQRR